jgi:hypothetical protein
MASEKITANGNRMIDVIGVDHAREILEVMGIDLHDATPDLEDACEWHCGVENRWWPISGRQLNLTDLYAVRWTETAEAGVDDVTIIEIVDDEQDAIDLGEWLRSIAANCGSTDGLVR